ncbi:MAG: RNA polymerase sporulation sigma factor SigE, partial [Romboutsia sp.]
MKSLILKAKAKLINCIVGIGIKLKIIKPKGVYYMGGVNVLPPPLNAEEEGELLQQLELDNNVKTVLIERNLRL